MPITEEQAQAMRAAAERRDTADHNLRNPLDGGADTLVERAQEFLDAVNDENDLFTQVEASLKDE